ncbi:PleD family two-component system response regulator [Spirosoma sp. KUDC1026]|uniref:response regulator n=1 Tax=Spirosoma sp. KUDC1026 TaxID=2745947 RepID=UPI00159BC751|nr:response regulator [Spirosoma sp. KUDC1026]QKZ14726.1 response regulator [Spirosoma sp. KUDC1026]
MTDELTFKILVVDDEPPVCELLNRTASKVFPEAVFVNTGSREETLTYLNQQPDNKPQLVLLDIDLGGRVDGLELLPQLWQQLEGAVPIIMLSSNDSQSNVARSYGEGAVAFTKKPDDMAGWKNYVTALKKYWYETSLLPGRNTLS